MNRICFLLIGVQLWTHTSFSQDWKQLPADRLFQLARETAFSGMRPEAREMLTEILKQNESYHDARILLGRTFAWDGQFDPARRELKLVLKQSPSNEDAINALTDVEIWSAHYDTALRVVNEGLSYFPNFEDFLYKKAQILKELHRPDEAAIELNRLLSINPSHTKGIALMNELKSARLKYTGGLTYDLNLFSRNYDPAHYLAAQITRNNNWGTSLLRLNYSNRFGEDGIQPELDLYPRIANGVYAYVNYGHSSSNLFPKQRLSGEIYCRLPKSFEISAGARYLFFDADNKVIIYTGSIGWYYKNYWLSYRPYFSPGEQTSFSNALSLRRYFRNGDNYLGVEGGLGFLPDERRMQSSSGLSTDGIYQLKSQRAGATWQKTLPKNFTITLIVTVTRQELAFDNGEYVIITGSSVSLKKRF